MYGWFCCCGQARTPSSASSSTCLPSPCRTWSVPRSHTDNTFNVYYCFLPPTYSLFLFKLHFLFLSNIHPPFLFNIKTLCLLNVSSLVLFSIISLFICMVGVGAMVEQSRGYALSNVVPARSPSRLLPAMKLRTPSLQRSLWIFCAHED